MQIETTMISFILIKMTEIKDKGYIRARQDVVEMQLSSLLLLPINLGLLCSTKMKIMNGQ